MYSKLFVLYPPPRETEATMSAYLEVTRDIPATWISFALHELIRQPDRRYAPSVGEIRKAAALAARKHYGGGGGDYNPVGEIEVDTERWLEVAREKERASRALLSSKVKP